MTSAFRRLSSTYNLTPDNRCGAVKRLPLVSPARLCSSGLARAKLPQENNSCIYLRFPTERYRAHYLPLTLDGQFCFYSLGNDPSKINNPPKFTPYNDTAQQNQYLHHHHIGGLTLHLQRRTGLQHRQGTSDHNGTKRHTHTPKADLQHNLYP
jgi:hypothetical protein